MTDIHMPDPAQRQRQRQGQSGTRTPERGARSAEKDSINNRKKRAPNCEHPPQYYLLVV